jgi:hypothetical protein
MRPPDATVTFVELAAPDARPRLVALAREVEAGGANVELLRSVDRDDLWLLVIRGRPPVGAAMPSEARTWRFAPAGSGR